MACKATAIKLIQAWILFACPEDDTVAADGDFTCMEENRFSTQMQLFRAAPFILGPEEQAKIFPTNLIYAVSLA